MTLFATIGGAEMLRDDASRPAGSDPAHPRLAVAAAYLVPQGTAGNDFIHVAGDGLVAPGGYSDDPSATAGNDTIDISQGGDDQVFSGAGDDQIHAGAALTAADIIDGGDGGDGLYLDGDYAGAHALTLSNVSHIEAVTLAAGHSYTLTTADAVVGAGQSMTFDGIALLAADALTFDGSAELDGKLEIVGAAGNDHLTGGGGADFITAGGGSNVVAGGGGDDIISDSGSASTLDGGAGADVLTLNRGGLGAAVTLSFTSGAAGTTTLPDGTTFQNFEFLNLTTGAGNDDVTFTSPVGYPFGSYTDRFDGGAGTDTVTVDMSAATDTVYMSPGQLISGISFGVQFANVERYHITLGAVAGLLTSGNGDDILTGGSGNDQLDGAGGANTISGGSGFDYVLDSGAGSTLDGGADFDRLALTRLGPDPVSFFWTSGSSTPVTLADGTTFKNFEILLLTTGSGDDNVTFDAPGRGFGGPSSWDGGDGNDTASINVPDFGSGYTTSLSGDTYSLSDVNGVLVSFTHVENFKISGTAEADTLTGGAGKDEFRGQDGNDTLNGGDGNDILIGNAGNDILNGGNNDDALFGGAGNDTIDGGAGYDTVYSDSDTLGFTANLATGLASGAGIGNDTLANVEAIQGGSGNDHLTGDGGDNHLYGNGGTNTLSGGGGNDSLLDTGSGGTFDGGSGSDFLFLDRSTLGANTIHFTSGSATPQTLSDGTSFVNIETLALFSGAGDDTMTYTFGATHPGPDDSGSGTWDAGGGNDSMTIDVSAFDMPVQAYNAGTYYTVGDQQGIYFVSGFNVESIHLIAGNGDDFFGARPGNNSFDGGAGVDRAGFFHGAHTDYAISYDAGTQSFTIADQRIAPTDPDGTATIKNVELFEFTDGVFTFDTQGRVTSQTVSDGIGGANMTVTDVAGTAGWSTQVVHTVLGSLASQTVTTDAGAQWVNTYDQAGTQPWAWTSDSYDAAGGHLTQTGTNDDGTHWLTLWIPAIQYGYTDITLTFDANWNQTGVSGNNGGVPLTMARIAPVLDTVLWFATPYDPDFNGPAAGGYGLGGAGIDGSGGLMSYGGPGIDILYGFAGDDWLEGGGGADYLNGGTGNDTLVGGVGDDRFVFKFGDGLDTIRDFAPGNASGDVIDLHGYGIANFAGLQALMTQTGADTLIAFDDQNHILLHNVALAQLNAGDFVLS